MTFIPISTKRIPFHLPLAGSSAGAKKPVPPIVRPHLPVHIERDDLSARIARARLHSQLVQYLKQDKSGEHPIIQSRTPRENFVLLRSMTIPAPRDPDPNRKVAVARVLNLFRAEARRQRKLRQVTMVAVPQGFVFCYNNLAWVEPYPRRDRNVSRISRNTPQVRLNPQGATVSTPQANLMGSSSSHLAFLGSPSTNVDPFDNLPSPSHLCAGDEIQHATVNILLIDDASIEDLPRLCSKSVSNTCIDMYP